MNFDIFLQLNWLAIFIAALVYFMLGALWYSKMLFGKQWATLVQLDMNDPNLKNGMGKMMAGSFVMMLVACIGLSLLIVKMDMTSMLAALKMGLLAGICFAATALSISFIYEKKPAALFFIDCGYHVCGLTLGSCILVLWR